MAEQLYWYISLVHNEPSPSVITTFYFHFFMATNLSSRAQWCMSMLPQLCQLEFAKCQSTITGWEIAKIFRHFKTWNLEWGHLTGTWDANPKDVNSSWTLLPAMWSPSVQQRKSKLAHLRNREGLYGERLSQPSL